MIANKLELTEPVPTAVAEVRLAARARHVVTAGAPLDVELPITAQINRSTTMKVELQTTIQINRSTALNLKLPITAQVMWSQPELRCM